MSKRAGLMLVVLLVGFLGLSSPAYADGLPPPPVLAVGAKAPPFTRVDLDGKPITLKDFRGKVVLLDFWASWCPPCLVEIPHFIKLQKRYRTAGLRVVGVSMDDSDEAVRDIRHRFAFNYPLLRGDAKLGEQFGGILGLPVRFLIGPDGKVIGVWKGELAATILDKAVASALARR